jgi:hypothetical protein
MASPVNISDTPSRSHTSRQPFRPIDPDLSSRTVDVEPTIPTKGQCTSPYFFDQVRTSPLPRLPENRSIYEYQEKSKRKKYPPNYKGTIYTFKGYLRIQTSNMEEVNTHLKGFCKYINKLNKRTDKIWSYHYMIFPNLERKYTTFVVYKFI